MYEASPKIEIPISAFKNCCPGKTIGCPLMKPWSLPNAIKLPVNVRVPTNTESEIVARLKAEKKKDKKNNIILFSLAVSVLLVFGIVLTL